MLRAEFKIQLTMHLQICIAELMSRLIIKETDFCHFSICVKPYISYVIIEYSTFLSVHLYSAFEFQVSFPITTISQDKYNLF